MCGGALENGIDPDADFDPDENGCQEQRITTGSDSSRLSIGHTEPLVAVQFVTVRFLLRWRQAAGCLQDRALPHQNRCLRKGQNIVASFGYAVGMLCDAVLMTLNPTRSPRTMATRIPGRSVLAVVGTLACTLCWMPGSVSPAVESVMQTQIHQRALRTAGVLASQWIPGVPETVLHQAVDPMLLAADAEQLIVVAESRRDGRSAIVVSRSSDSGETWGQPQEVHVATAGRVTVGAGGRTVGGRLALVLHEWTQTKGKVTWTSEAPRGVHHYSWSGFRRSSVMHVLLSSDDGQTWSTAGCELEGGPIAPAAMGRVFAAHDALWFAVHGPADQTEMDGALGGVGLMRSDDDGASWRFSHWVVRADKQAGVGYGRGEIAVLPDGRWLAMVGAELRGRGDYVQTRTCRLVSEDGGRTWSTPEMKMIGQVGSLVVVGGERVMTSSWHTGMRFNVFDRGAERFLHQGHVWISLGGGARGGLHLTKRDDRTVLCVYYWRDEAKANEPVIRFQILRNVSAGAPLPEPPRKERQTKAQWIMAEALQVPDLADAPAGLRINTLMKLAGGDWICIAFAGTTTTSQAAYGFGASGLCVVKSPAIDGPWAKVAPLPIPEQVGDVHDPGAGTGMPDAISQHSSGRLFLSFTSKDRKDIILTTSDDEGLTWQTVGSMAKITGLPQVCDSAEIVEQNDGSIIFPLVTGQWPTSLAHLFYVRSPDRGQTWSDPVFWATHPGTHYEGLPHGRAGDLRELAMAIIDERHWIGVYREERGSPIPENPELGPLGMPVINVSQSDDGGRTWRPTFGFIGVEPAIAATPDGTVFCAYRAYSHGSVWISDDGGHSWQYQEDPVEIPWGKASAQKHGQWPPGGNSCVRVLDDDTVVVTTDTGIIPSGKVLPDDYKGSRELYGRAQVRFFRRVRADAAAGVLDSED